MKTIVMKFGGSSIADASSIDRVARIVRAHLDRRPVVVVSAMGKTTRKLLQAAQLASENRTKETLRLIAELEDYHLTEARAAIPGFQDLLVHSTVQGYFEEMRDLVRGIAILREFSPRSQDAMAAYGELISSAILAAALKVRNVEAILLDSRSLLITDDNFTRASPIPGETEEKVRAAVLSELASERVPVLQGFIGSTRDGATTTLGFEGSDYSAAIFGAALGAEDIQIWKDVSGLMTADPVMVPEARTVEAASFEEMAELTYFGAKLLHPSAIWPAARQGIPVHIFNSLQPEAAGTVIYGEGSSAACQAKSVAYKRGLSLLHLTSSRSQSASEFLKSVFDLIDRHQVPPNLAVVSNVSVALAFGNDKKIGLLAEELRRLGEVKVCSERASLCLVGQGIREIPETSAKLLSSVPHFKFDLITEGASPNSIVLVIHEKDLEKALLQVHKAFFS
ncbi:MAG TPA: aspartate kinase [Terriglobia bacterium]|nr:aspartate kinase [Terriglobia bacterium]